MSMVVESQTSISPTGVEAPADWTSALGDVRHPGSRLRELLAMLAVLLAVAGVGALMVACTG